MDDQPFETGTKVLVNNNGSEEWLERIFAVKYNGFYQCENLNNNSRLERWLHCKALPEVITPTPHTFETFPKGFVLIRCVGDKAWRLSRAVGTETLRLVNAWSTTGITAGSSYFEYEALAQDFELSTNAGFTWKPATQEGAN